MKTAYFSVELKLGISILFSIIINLHQKILFFLILGDPDWEYKIKKFFLLKIFWNLDFFLETQKILTNIEQYLNFNPIIITNIRKLILILLTLILTHYTHTNTNTYY